jgi:hypothetical protein
MQESRGYLGNVNLKKKGTTIDWTPEMIQEFIKCSEDPIYFAEKYIQIVHVDHGLIPIELYDYQKEIIEKTTNNRRVAVVTSRQAGKTTTAVVIILHFALFNDHKTVALLANKGDAAREILDRVQIAYQALPKWLQQGVVEWNKGSVSFENGCKILAGSTSSSAIRGKSISFLYIDETAFVENWDKFFASVFPTISSGNTTKILLTSTPQGLNHFFKTVVGAREKRNGYELIEVPWQRVPGRDDAWKQETLDAMDGDTEKFAQEFDCEFLGSSGTLISGDALKSLVHQTPLHQKNGFNIYKYPEPGKPYACVVDVSRGKGLDYSAYHIIDVSKMPYEQVATFRDNLTPPVDFVQLLYSTLRTYNDASVLIEVNDIGGQVADLLHYDYEYENILKTDTGGSTGKKISTTGKGDRGVRTTKTVKNVGCSILKLLIEQKQLIINDFETIKELSTFSRKRNSYQAEDGCHDDLAMCLVLFAWLSNQKYFKEMTDINTLIKLREKTELEIEQTILPFGLKYDASDEINNTDDEFRYSDFNAW